MLLSIAYFPPIEYFAYLAKYSCFVDRTEKYRKQTWRNRCTILTANGPMDLRFPIIHNGNYRIDEVLVDYSVPWVRQTRYAIETAYYASPFFEYYRDSLFSILDSCPATLWELDSRLTEYFCSKIGVRPPLSVGGVPDGEEDMRDKLSPKQPSGYVGREYWQVFRERFGFVPGLSVMDLLFNEGPESLGYLMI